jgi:SH3-like domain-containing protein
MRILILQVSNELTHLLDNKPDVMRKANWLVLSCVATVAILACKKDGAAGAVGDTLPATTIVTSADLKMRIAPNTTAVEIAKLTRGEVVKIVQRSADAVQVGKLSAHWYKVTNTAGLTGWVYGAHLAVESNDGDAKGAIEQAEKKLKTALLGRWDAAKITGALTAYFVTLMPDGQIEFGNNRKGLQYGKYEIAFADGVATVNVSDVQKPLMTDLKAKMVGETLVFTASLNGGEYKLNLSEKDPELFRDQEKKKAAGAAPATP